ncbi:uncharacterized protein LOC131927540 [Physella acuta]|uniref:uncharacterized protein LOC131927540 n=1 Tax=Physella acuta TaxID=109671 RepID=UPI0027DE1307|nr:uncharacterized protein LOC131927540 [Physella acuta]
MKTRALLQVCVTSALMALTLGAVDVNTKIYDIHQLMRAVDQQLVDLSKRTCQTGTGYVELCPLKDAYFYDVLYCLLAPLKGKTYPKTVEIKFASPFITTPTAVVFTSGLSWAVGGGYRLDVAGVTPTGMTVKVDTDVLLAVGSVQFNYIACDTELPSDHTDHGAGVE